ncbi:MAG: CBS domain-containing protein [Bacillota bacterium]
MTIDRIMNYHTITAKVQDTIAKAYEIMIENGVNGTPVVDEENNLQGMIVKADIYRFLTQPGHYDTCPVEWVMTKEVVTAYKNEDIVTIAKRLRENDIIAIPIVDMDKKVIGIVSIEDIVDYFIEHYK